MNKKPYIALLLWIAVMLASTIYLLTAATVDTSLISIFSSNTSQNRAQQINQLQFGPASRLVLGSIQGAKEEYLAKHSKVFINMLRETQQFSFITNGQPPSGFGPDNPLFPYRYLLSAKIANNTFDTEYLKKSFSDVNKILRAPFSLTNKESLSKDPTGEWPYYLNSFSGEKQPIQYQGVWFSNDKSKALFILFLSETTAQLDNLEQQIFLIRKTFKKTITKNNAGTITLTLSGPAIFATHSRNTIRSEVQKLSLWATISVVLILLFVYRSPKLVLLSAVPVGTSILIAATIVDIYFGSIHGITLAFGATLLGVVIDYPIHLFSHAHKNENISHSVKYCWPTIRLGMFTTVAAYLAMAFADFAGLSQLGIFAMVGIFAGAITTRWVVPTLISATLNLKHSSVAEILTRQFMKPNGHLAVVSIGVSILIISVAIMNNKGSLLQSDLRQFSSTSKQLMEQHRKLKQDLHIPDSANVIMISAVNAEMALRKTEAISIALEPLIVNGELQSFDAVSRYLPSQMTQHQRQSALPNSTTLMSAINQATSELSFKTVYFNSFREAISTSKNNIEPLKPLDPLTQPGTLLGNKLSSLLFQQENRWISLLPLYGVLNETQIRQVIVTLPASEGADVQYFNTQHELTLMMDQYLTETISRIIWGSVVMLVILAVGLRSWQRLLRVILPITLGVSVTTAVLLMGAGSLSIFHIVALLLTAGISIDYALFFSRDSQELYEKQNTFTAIGICAISTIAVFGILGSSDIPVLKAIGKTVSIGVVVAFILTLMLAQPGRFFNKK